ncbi:hypothetical protein BDR22DRAFT_966296 [Usnea florida]
MKSVELTQLTKAGISAIVQSKGVKKTVYEDSENETSWHLGVALFAGRRRRVTHSSALLRLPRTMDEAREQFNRLGWKYFIEDLYHYDRWVEWSESNASLIIGGRELREYCSSAKIHSSCLGENSRGRNAAASDYNGRKNWLGSMCWGYSSGEWHSGAERSRVRHLPRMLDSDLASPDGRFFGDGNIRELR